MIGKSNSVVFVESVDSVDGIVNRIVINKTKAEKYGFRIVIDETEQAIKRVKLKNYKRISLQGGFDYEEDF